MEEFYEKILSSRTGIRIPIPTYFIDSTNYSSPLMNAPKSKDGMDIVKNFRFLGRSGVQIIGGLRIAFINGVDIDSMAGIDK